MQRSLIFIAGLALFAGIASAPAQASFVLDLTQEGNNVVATGSGTLNLTDLSFIITDNFVPGMQADLGSIYNGSATTLVDVYTSIAGPANFGLGIAVDASSVTGDAVGVVGGEGSLSVPHGYVSGDPLSGSETFDNQTLGSLGVADGTYVWTWGSGADADSFTLNIGVPGPSSLSLFLPALGGLGAIRRRRAARG